MSQQLMFIGIVSGIQTMNVLIGDTPTQNQFAVTFAVGLGAAILGLLAAFGAAESRRL
jgi:hypothetical protein